MEHSGDGFGTGVACADLSMEGLIEVSGDDAVTFLQGQLTSDVRKVTPTAAQYSGLCTPKGRLLASFLIWRRGDRLYLQLPDSQREFVQKRLSMYVLRSKVRLTEAGGQWQRYGIVGPDAAACIDQALGGKPDAAMAVLQLGDVSVIRLDAQRFVVVLPAGAARPAWLDGLSPLDAAQWRLLDIRAGVPRILPETREEFVPQMANFDLIQAVDFKKGCYTGQEIVARMQYLGKLKRRMYLVHAAGELSPGEPVFSPDMEGQASGMVVDAQPAHAGGWDALVVAQISSVENQPLFAGSLQGVALTRRDLPYVLALPDA